MNNKTFLQLFLGIIRDHPRKPAEWKWHELTKLVRSSQEKELCPTCGKRMIKYWVCTSCQEVHFDKYNID